MSAKKYELTPEHREQLKSWADKWIATAMRTRAMDDGDREAMRVAIEGLYRAANLQPPPRERIVFGASPRIMAFAGSIAAGVWYLRDHGDFARTLLFGGKTPTLDATRTATLDATSDATRDATIDATSARLPAVRWLLSLLPKWGYSANGGNHWSGWTAYLSFFRHVAKLDLPIYEKFKHYEAATEHGCWRYMHAKFCIVSDFPAEIHVNERRQPHRDDGPSHVWRDGWKFWYIDGVRVTEQIVMRPETLTIAQIKGEQNAEVRRIMRTRFGEGRYLRETKARLVHCDYEGAKVGAAPRALIEDDEGQRFLVGTDGSTSRSYYMLVPSTIETCRAAHEARIGFDETRIKGKS